MKSFIGVAIRQWKHGGTAFALGYFFHGRLLRFYALLGHPGWLWVPIAQRVVFKILFFIKILEQADAVVGFIITDNVGMLVKERHEEHKKGW